MAKQIGAYLTDELYERVVSEAKLSGMKPSEVIRRAIAIYLGIDADVLVRCRIFEAITPDISAGVWLSAFAELFMKKFKMEEMANMVDEMMGAHKNDNSNKNH